MNFVGNFASEISAEVALPFNFGKLNAVFVTGTQTLAVTVRAIVRSPKEGARESVLENLALALAGEVRPHADTLRFYGAFNIVKLPEGQHHFLSWAAAPADIRARTFIEQGPFSWWHYYLP